ncbi:MAG: HdeD family acid-resistance protein [Cyclobacteriaceae bacterium]|nr:HdeD family acid-resistance protein [Cyclobacteriaceae bacterium]
MNNLNKIKSTINNWWIYLLLGILFLMGSFYVFSVPAKSYLTLSIFFAAFMLIDGIGAISLSLSNREKMEGWGRQLAGGIISAIIGLVLFIHPNLSMNVLPLFVGFWVLMRGSLVIGSSFDLKSHGVKSWGWVLVMGIINAVLGLMMIANPIFGVSMVLIFTGVSLLSLGVSMIAVSLWLRKVKMKVTQLKEHDNEKLVELRESVENYINDNPDDIQRALKQIKEKVDEALKG